MKSQVDLLRVLETGQFNRIGGEDLLCSDARIVSATNKDALSLVHDGSFRDDLYYRLNIVPLKVPPLRQRREDIPLLVEHFINHFCARHKRPTKRFSDKAMNQLINAVWPGNVRQLRNVIERLIVTHVGDMIEAKSLPAELVANRDPTRSRITTLAEATEMAEKQAIVAALSQCDFHREQTAKTLGVSVRTLHYKMSRYGLH